MKNKKVSLFDSIITGVGIGVPITLACMTLIGGFNSVIGEFLTWTVASALFGVVSKLMFDVFDKLSLPLSLLIHCVLCLTIATGAAAICGYSDSFVELLLAILPVFIIVYVLVYVFIFIKMKNEEKMINNALKNK